jgi:tetratricopeptide (TPR) repeat protein
LSSQKELVPPLTSRKPPSQNADKPPKEAVVQQADVIRPKTIPPAIQPTSPTKKAAKSASKKELSLLSKLDDSANKPTKRPKPKPKRTPPKSANPEALKWAQKSYDSLMNGDNSEAIIAATVAITLDPELTTPYINRAWAYSNKGQYDKAIADCDIAIKKAPKSMLAYNNRGVAYQGKGDSEKAKADYQKACSLGLELACKNYEEIVTADTVDRLLKQSLTHFSQKQWDDVITSASKALKLSPNNVTAHANRSAAYIQKGLYEMALKDCNKAIEIKPDYALAYNNRGSALELLGRKEEAALDYVKSCSLGFNLGCQNAEKIDATP